MLGPLEARSDDGAPLALGRRKQRALLALLLLHANRTVARDRLLDELWGETLPKTAVTSVHVYVSRLRKSLPDGVLLTRPPGYVVQVAPEAIDLLRFERLVADARDATPVRAAALLREALGLWRGAALAEFGEEPFARVEAARLEELRLAALEDRIEADLALARHGDLVGEVEALVAAHPHRERLRAQLILALYRSNRQAEALGAYRAARASLDGLGLEPGQMLRQLERQVLAQDAALDLGRVVLAEPAVLPGPLASESPFPFVGRNGELATLRSLLARAEAGAGGLAMLSGAPGAGKTRLVGELARDAAERGALVCYGASDAVVVTPYQPLRDWLEFLISVCDPDALGECLGTQGTQLTRLVPELERITGPAAGDAQGDRFALQSAAIELLGRLSRRQPLLLVLDDAHWADGETLHLVRRLGRRAAQARWLVLVPYRSEDASSALTATLADLSRLDGVTRISLGGLAAEQVSDFIRASARAEATPELLSAVNELTDGSPLLVCELWRDLVARSAVEVVGGYVRLVQPVAELRGPQRIHEFLEQRLSSLEPATIGLVELAAVAGPRFELPAVAAAAGYEQTALAAAVEEATRTGFLEELPEPAPSYRFTHELVRRHLYDRIASVRRVELHLRIGEALERVHASDPSRTLSELARHFTLAAQLAGVERAVAYNLRAAEAATAAAAHGEAAERLAATLELGIDDPGERVRVQVALARALRRKGRSAEAAALFGDAHVAATMLGERGLVARALMGNSELRLNSDPDVSSTDILPILEEAVRTLRELDDEPGLAEAERLLGMALSHDGDERAAHAAFERALVHAEAAGDGYTRRFVVKNVANRYWRGSTPVDDAIVRLEQLRATSGDDSLLEAIIGCCLSYVLAMGDGSTRHARSSRRALRACAQRTDSAPRRSSGGSPR